MDNDKLYDVERKIQSSFAKKIELTARPDFGWIAHQIASDEPTESFDSFFEGDFIKADSRALPKKPVSWWKIIAGASAAVFVLFTAGWIMLNMIISNMNLTKSAQDSSPRYEMSEAFEAGGETCEDDSDSYVSDSDLSDGDGDSSSETSE